MKRRLFLLGVLAVMLGCGLGWLLVPDREPLYQGKSLNSWLEPDLNRIGGPEPGTIIRDLQIEFFTVLPPVTDAIRAAGTRAVPYFLRDLRAHDSRLKLELVALARHQSLVPFNFTPAEQKHWLGLIGLGVLGRGASNAGPNLIQFCDANDSTWHQAFALGDLGLIGPRASNAVPALLRALSRSTNTIVRLYAIFALGNIHAQPDLAVPALVNLLEDPDASIRVQAAFELARFGTNATSAIPALERVAGNVEYPGSGGATVTNLAVWARNSIRIISDPPAAAAAGIWPAVEK